MTMDLYPSIDLLGGKVVRLLRGNYDAETVYNDDAVAGAGCFHGVRLPRLSGPRACHAL